MNTAVTRHTGLLALLFLGLATVPLQSQEEGSRISIGSMPAQRTVISLPGHAAPMLLDTLGVGIDLPSGVDVSFAALSFVYDALKVPVQLRDAKRRYVGNLHFTKMRSLAGSPMSAWIDCGSDQTGPRADQYRVHLAVVSRIDTLAGGRSRVRSTVVAGAEDVQGSSKAPIPCGSTGSLEARINGMVLIHVKAIR